MAFTMDRWVGKVAIVTGASAGIGEAIARRLVHEGVKVVGLARRKDRLNSIANSLSGEKGQFFAYQADISKEEDILKAFEYTKNNVGPLHILVNNAGIYRPSTIADVKTEDIKAMLDVNLVSLTIACREALNIFEENKIAGHIININSIAGQSVLEYPTVSIYSVSKHGVTTFTKYLQLEIERKKLGTKVTSISPGLVETDIVGEKVLEQARKNPYYAGMKTEDIANAAMFVLSTPPHCQVEEVTLRPIYAKV